MYCPGENVLILNDLYVWSRKMYAKMEKKLTKPHKMTYKLFNFWLCFFIMIDMKHCLIENEKDEKGKRHDIIES